jgi:hypothetical protein
MKPPPMAKPLTAAITGFSSVPSMKGSGIGGRFPPGVPVASDSFMSSPAQKPRPVPVKIATSRALSCRNSVQISARAVRISVLSALSRSGRFMRTTSTCPSRSVSTTAMRRSPQYLRSAAAGAPETRPTVLSREAQPPSWPIRMNAMGITQCPRPCSRLFGSRFWSGPERRIRNAVAHPGSARQSRQFPSRCAGKCHHYEPEWFSRPGAPGILRACLPLWPQ